MTDDSLSATASPDGAIHPRPTAVVHRRAPTAARVLFLRSRGGTDRVTCLWRYDVATRTETLIADPLATAGR